MVKIRSKEGTELFHIIRSQRECRVDWHNAKKYLEASDLAYKIGVSIDRALTLLNNDISLETGGLK